MCKLCNKIVRCFNCQSTIYSTIYNAFVINDKLRLLLVFDVDTINYFILHQINNILFTKLSCNFPHVELIKTRLSISSYQRSHIHFKNTWHSCVTLLSHFPITLRKKIRILTSWH